MKKKFVIFITIVLSFALKVSAQEAKLQDEGSNYKSLVKIGVMGVPQDILELCSKFFNTIIENKIEKAFQDLLNNSPLQKIKDELEKLISEAKRANLLYGLIKSYEPVSSDIVSDSFIRVRYLAYHTDFPLRWVLTFYKSPKYGWIVVNIRFDDLSEFFFKGD